MQMRMGKDHVIEKIAIIIEQLNKGEATAHLAKEIREPFDKIIRKYETELKLMIKE